MMGFTLFKPQCARSRMCIHFFLSLFVDYLSDWYVHISHLSFCPAFYHVQTKEVL